MTITIELFVSPDCRHCASAKQALHRAVEELDAERLTWRVVDVLDELDYAVALGVLATPAVAIDGKLVFTAMPGERKLRRALERRLAEVVP